MEISRREFVNEMLLEPISGLEQTDYLPETELTPGLDRHAALRFARQLEERNEALYLEAAEEIGHLPQLTRVFRKLGHGNGDHRGRLDSLGGD